MKKILIAALCLLSQASSLEFGQKGNLAPSMGGAGVAYSKNHWAMYYNPALLGMNDEFSFAISAGAGYRNKNILELIPLIDEIQKSQENKQENNGGTTGAAILAGANSSSHAMIPSSGMEKTIEEMLKNISVPNGSETSSGKNGTAGTQKLDLTTNEGLKKYLEELNKQPTTSTTTTTTTTTTSNGSLNEQAKKLQETLNKNNGDAEKITNKLKQDLSTALSATTSGSAQDKLIIQALIDGTTPETLGQIAKSVSSDGNGSSGSSTSTNGAKLDPSKLFGNLGEIGVSSSISPDMKSLIATFYAINQAISNGWVGLNLNASLLVQFPINGEEGHHGTLGLGYMGSGYGAMGLKLNDSHKNLILKAGNLYLKVNTTSDKISLKASNKSEFDSTSALSPNASLRIGAKGLVLNEIPLSYGTGFSTDFGDLAVGVSLKYLYSLSFNQVYDLTRDNIAKLAGKLKENKDTYNVNHNFSIDLGLLYRASDFSIGLVGKHLNSPRIKNKEGEDFFINPQLRAGVAWEPWGWLTILADIDVLPNDVFSISKNREQNVGGGVMFDLWFMDIRLGALRNLRDKDIGTVLTAGLNLFAILDVSVQSSLKTVKYGNYKIPHYFNVSLASRFSL